MSELCRFNAKGYFDYFENKCFCNADVSLDRWEEVDPQSGGQCPPALSEEVYIQALKSQSPPDVVELLTSALAKHPRHRTVSCNFQKRDPEYSFLPTKWHLKALGSDLLRGREALKNLDYEASQIVFLDDGLSLAKNPEAGERLLTYDQLNLIPRLNNFGRHGTPVVGIAASESYGVNPRVQFNMVSIESEQNFFEPPGTFDLEQVYQKLAGVAQSDRGKIVSLSMAGRESEDRDNIISNLLAHEKWIVTGGDNGGRVNSWGANSLNKFRNRPCLFMTSGLNAFGGIASEGTFGDYGQYYLPSSMVRSLNGSFVYNGLSSKIYSGVSFAIPQFAAILSTLVAKAPHLSCSQMKTLIDETSLKRGKSPVIKIVNPLLAFDVLNRDHGKCSKENSDFRSCIQKLLEPIKEDSFNQLKKALSASVNGCESSELVFNSLKEFYFLSQGSSESVLGINLFLKGFLSEIAVDFLFFQVHGLESESLRSLSANQFNSLQSPAVTVGSDAFNIHYNKHRTEKFFSGNLLLKNEDKIEDSFSLNQMDSSVENVGKFVEYCAQYFQQIYRENQGDDYDRCLNYILDADRIFRGKALDQILQKVNHIGQYNVGELYRRLKEDGEEELAKRFFAKMSHGLAYVENERHYTLLFQGRHLGALENTTVDQRVLIYNPMSKNYDKLRETVVINFEKAIEKTGAYDGDEEGKSRIIRERLVEFDNLFWSLISSLGSTYWDKEAKKHPWISEHYPEILTLSDGHREQADFILEHRKLVYGLPEFSFKTYFKKLDMFLENSGNISWHALYDQRTRDQFYVELDFGIVSKGLKSHPDYGVKLLEYFLERSERISNFLPIFAKTLDTTFSDWVLSLKDVSDYQGKVRWVLDYMVDGLSRKMEQDSDPSQIGELSLRMLEKLSLEGVAGAQDLLNRIKSDQEMDSTNHFHFFTRKALLISYLKDPRYPIELSKQYFQGRPGSVVENLFEVGGFIENIESNPKMMNILNEELEKSENKPKLAAILFENSVRSFMEPAGHKLLKLAVPYFAEMFKDNKFSPTIYEFALRKLAIVVKKSPLLLKEIESQAIQYFILEGTSLNKETAYPLIFMIATLNSTVQGRRILLKKEIFKTMYREIGKSMVKDSWDILEFGHHNLPWDFYGSLMERIPEAEEFIENILKNPSIYKPVGNNYMAQKHWIYFAIARLPDPLSKIEKYLVRAQEMHSLDPSNYTRVFVSGVPTRDFNLGLAMIRFEDTLKSYIENLKSLDPLTLDKLRSFSQRHPIFKKAIRSAVAQKMKL